MYRHAYHRCEDGMWAAHTTALNPFTKEAQMLVGFGRRKEQARKALKVEVETFVMEVYNEEKEKQDSESKDPNEECIPASVSEVPGHPF